MDIQRGKQKWNENIYFLNHSFEKFWAAAELQLGLFVLEVVASAVRCRFVARLKGTRFARVPHLYTVLSSNRVCSEVYLSNCEGGCEHYG
jgi:hypothetical protein